MAAAGLSVTSGGPFLIPEPVLPPQHMLPSRRLCTRLPRSARPLCSAGPACDFPEPCFPCMKDKNAAGMRNRLNRGSKCSPPPRTPRGTQVLIMGFPRLPTRAHLIKGSEAQGRVPHWPGSPRGDGQSWERSRHAPGWQRHPVTVCSTSGTRRLHV